MSEFKKIREWIGEGAESLELWDEEGRVLVVIDCVEWYAVMADLSLRRSKVSLNHLVRSGASTFLSNEDLLTKYVGSLNRSSREEIQELRAKVLARMEGTR